MTIVKVRFVRDELGFRIEKYEVRVKAFGDAAFARVAPGKARRTFGHPTRDIVEREAAARGFGPHDRQSQREAGDPSPGGSKAAFFEALHFRRARGMIGGHQINDAVLQAAPELLAIVAAADGRSAFEKCMAVENRLRRKMEVVWASFDTHRQP